MPEISLALIARNEAHDLPACLESVKGLVSEIVLVDNMSSDDTARVAESLGARVQAREFDSYASQKNHALGMASNDWVLHLDPDETLTPELKAEIAALFKNGAPEKDAYSVPYINYFLGRRMRHGGLAAERHVRLFRKSKAAFGGGLVHEGIVVKGSVGALRNPVSHNSYPDMEEYLEKFNRYTTLAAQKLHVSGKRFSYFKVCAVPFEFAKRYILRLGFLDGFPGLVWSAVCAFYVFVKYVKLWRIEKGERQ
ncbi:MAG: glycosyltransferase family 2 protein [Elusimicrobiales bacterium]|nr:glycosyltransferase family 2 protein [Elusimicrobiales bacterium]